MELDRVEAAVGVLETEIGSLQVDGVDRGSAARLVGLFARVERVGAAGTALLARRVGDPGLVAATTGTSVGKARAVLGLSERLRDTPDLDEAVRTGSVSLDQATEIAKAETAVPGSAAELVTVARRQPYHVLRERARQRVLADDRVGLGQRQRRARRASHRITDLGMIHIEADLEPHVGTPIVRRIEAQARRLEAAARRRGDDERREALMADAFAEAFSGSGGNGSTEMVILVSHQVAQRGWTDVEDDEICAIPGVGPVDPAVAKRIAEDAFLSGVFFDGTDLRHLRRFGRTIPVEVRLALSLGEPPAFDGPRCVDCGNRWSLEHDHVVPFVDGGPTSVGNLRLRCGPCHIRKTADDRRRRRPVPGDARTERSERGPP
jgi:hypothetical protein